MYTVRVVSWPTILILVLCTNLLTPVGITVVYMMVLTYLAALKFSSDTILSDSTIDLFRNYLVFILMIFVVMILLL